MTKPRRKKAPPKKAPVKAVLCVLTLDSGRKFVWEGDDAETLREFLLFHSRFQGIRKYIGGVGPLLPAPVELKE